MNLAPRLADLLACDLSERLQTALPAYCLRVDDLSREDALRICTKMRDLGDHTGDLVYVLDRSPGGDERLIDTEHAVEIRNRKTHKFCLFVPSGHVDSTTGSYKNSFFHYDLDDAFQRISRGLVEEIPDDVRFLVHRVAQVLRGATKVASERWSDYVAAVGQDPTAHRAGIELWRVGLVPDAGGEDFADRLDRNRSSIIKLAYPGRPQSVLAERVESLGLRAGSMKDELQATLGAHRLREVDSWLPTLAHEPHLRRISFDAWVFEDIGSDLEKISVQPILDADGKVRAFTKLTQPLGPGTQPVASVASKSRVTIKWDPVPPKPLNLARWSLELIPARGEYTEDEILGVELPSTTVPPSRRSGSVPLALDIDFEELTVRAVQVRVTGQDPAGTALTDEHGHVVEGLSGEFWLTQDPPPAGAQTMRRETAPNFAYARLHAAIELRDPQLEEAAGQWEERDLHYYPVMFNGRRVSRVAVSPVLRALEGRILEHPESLGMYSATIDTADTLDVESGLTALATSKDDEAEAWQSFLEKRRSVFQALRHGGPRDLIETAPWSSELSSKVRRYATAYRGLLNCGDAEVVRRALLVDTLQLTVERAGGSEPVLVVAPTHPLRLLWYASYAELLGAWEREVLALTGDRKRSVDMELLARVAPLNVPALMPPQNNTPFLFAQNLCFFWGVALPADARDPARSVSDVAGILGLPEDEVTLVDLPPARLASELKAYCDVHPYLDTLRINAVNAGAGGFLSQALERIYIPSGREDEEEDGWQPPRLDLLAHVRGDVAGLPPVADLQSRVYALLPRGSRRHLTPYFSHTVRPLADADRLPGGDVNVSVLNDYLVPSVEGLDDETLGDSASFFGLLVRMIPEFESAEGGCRWRYRFCFPAAAPREKHPVASWLTNELIDTQREMLGAVARLISPDCGGCGAAITAEISPDERIIIDRLHAQSDWVIILDRFLGAEFFDDPSDTNIGSVARKYLLDYAPEFLEGLGHRMLVTTSHREEIEEILSRAMGELGFGLIEESTGEVLDYLKTISGRLALRVVGNDSHAREAVSLGLVAAYLKTHGELDDAILVPVDAHPELFGPNRPLPDEAAKLRCDLVRVQLQRGRLVATFIEVKSRSANLAAPELMERIADQVTATENVFRELFFRQDPPRTDHVLQRSRLLTMLHFYLRRARRHRLIKSEEQYRKLEEGLAKLESGIPAITAERWGFVVNLAATPTPPVKHRGVLIRLITQQDVVAAGLSLSAAPAPPRESVAARVLPDEPQQSVDSAAGPSAPTHPTAEVETTGEQREVKELAPDREAVQPEIVILDEVEPPEPAPKTLPSEPPGQALSVELGDTLLDQDPVLWQPSIKGSPHMFVLGIPGQGKSWAVTRILCSLAEQGLPSLVMDFHGQFGTASSPYAQIAKPSVMNAAEGLPFSPFEADAAPGAGAGAWKTNCFAVSEIFEYVCGLGEMQRDVVFSSLKACYEDLGYASGTQTRFPTVDEFAVKLGEVESTTGVKNVVARCRPFLEFELFSDVAQTDSPLATLFERGVVLDVHELGVEALQLAAGAFLLRKLYKDMVRWGESDRLRLAIVLDEAHRLAKDITLPKLMKEGRKFGIVVIVASQGLADYHVDVVGNAGTKVVFRTNHPQSKKVAGFLKASKKIDLTDQIEQLGVGEAFVQTPEMSIAARVRMHPLENTGV